MKRIFVLSLLLCAAALAARTAPAQTQGAAAAAPARQRLSVTVIRVKPEAVADFENMVRADINPALAKGGARWSDVWRTAAFGDTFEYYIVAPIDSFAQYDGPGPLERGLGREGFAAWIAKASRLVDGVRSFAMEFIPDLSHETKMTGPPKLAVVSFVSVAPGRTAEYEGYIRNELLPVIRRSNVPGYWVQRTVMGGNPNEYITLTLHDNFADMEKGPPTVRVLGQDGAAKLVQKLAPGVVTHIERRVIRLNPGLTFRPAQAATK